jgi:uncharacterized protein YjbI with pentapeptide repeats
MSQSPTPQLGQPSSNLPPQPPKICLDPVDLDFRAMAPNDLPKTLQITVRNCGGQQLHWSTGGGGLEVKPSKGTLDSNQSESVTVTLNPGPNTLPVRFNSSDGSSIDLIVTVPLKVTLKSRKWWAARTGVAGKTLWDSLQLLGTLAIPIVVVIVAAMFSAQLSAQQAAANSEQARDQQQETIYQAYLDRMSDLIETGKLADPHQQGIRALAQSQTFAALRRSDAKRKGYIIQFLHDALLLAQPKPIVNLNLIGGVLHGADLSNAHLNGADLSSVDLSSVDLSGAALSSAALSNAHLNGANLTNAILTAANLSGATLSNAHLKGVRNLTPQQLREVYSCTNAILSTGLTVNLCPHNQ